MPENHNLVGEKLAAAELALKIISSALINHFPQIQEKIIQEVLKLSDNNDQTLTGEDKANWEAVKPHLFGNFNLKDGREPNS